MSILSRGVIFKILNNFYVVIDKMDPPNILDSREFKWEYPCLHIKSKKLWTYVFYKHIKNIQTYNISDVLTHYNMDRTPEWIFDYLSIKFECEYI